MDRIAAPLRRHEPGKARLVEVERIYWMGDGRSFPQASAIMNISKDSTHLPLNQHLVGDTCAHARPRKDASEPGLESRPQQKNIGLPPQDALQQVAMLSLPPALMSSSPPGAIEGNAPASNADASDPTLCRQRAEQGDAQAQLKLGAMYLLGTRVARDASQAFMWTRRAAEQGNAVAQRRVSAMCLRGEGVKRDEAEAMRWLRKAAEQGDADAQFELARCYLNGTGVEKDTARAMHWLHEAAGRGSAQAQTRLGQRYLDGEDVEKDWRKSFDWYRRAAAQGESVALRRLACMYRDGVHVDPDPGKALQWFLKLAQSRTACITRLDFRGFRMGDGIVCRLALELQRAPVIKELVLDNNLIGDKGAAGLAALIARNASLQALSLEGNAIDVEGLKAIARAMRVNSALREIRIDDSENAGQAEQISTIRSACEGNRRLSAMLARQERAIPLGWQGFSVELLSQLEQALIRIDIKLRASPSEEIERCLLEMQLCLSSVQLSSGDA